MNFLNYKISGVEGDLIRVKVSDHAFVRLLDPMNFSKYSIGRPYKGMGGFTEKEIVEFELPYKGNFHVTVDLGGKEGLIKATVDVIRFH